MGFLFPREFFFLGFVDILIFNSKLKERGVEMKSKTDWERERLQEKMREFERGESFWEHEFEFALEDAKELDEQESLREAVRKGVKVRIQKIRQGSEGDTFITRRAIEMFGLEEEKASFEEAVTENCRIQLSKVIENLKKDWVHTSDYRFHRDYWRRLAERVPELKEEFEKTLLAYRERHGLVDYERIEEKIEKLAKEHSVSVKRWWREENRIVIWVASGKELITDRIVEKHSKKVEHYEYTPEDMSEPLEEYDYITFETTEDELKKVFNEARQIQQEIEAARIRVKKKICKIAKI